MFQRHSGPRLSLKAALKRYWLWLLPLVLCSGIIFFVPNSAAHSYLIAVLFFAAAASAGWPWFKYDAPYSFWMFACVLWFCSGLVFPIISGIIGESFRHAR